MRRVLHIVGRVALWLGVGGAGLVGLVALALFTLGHTDWARSKLLAVIVPIVQKQLNGKLTIGRLRGDLLHSLVVEDVALDDVEGQPVARAHRVEAHYRLLALLHKTLHITFAEGEGLWVHARYLKDGRLNLAALVKPSDKPPDDRPSPYTVRVDEVKLDLSGSYDGPAQKTKQAVAQAAQDAAPAIVRKVPAAAPLAAALPTSAEVEETQRPDLLSHLGAHLSVVAGGKIKSGDIQAAVRSLSLDVQEPLAAGAKLSGAMHMAGDAITLSEVALHLQLDAEALNLLLPPGQGHAQGRYQVDLKLNGPLSALVADLNVLPPKGTMNAHALIGAKHAQESWQISVNAAGLDPGAGWKGAPHGQIDLDASGSGSGAQGSVDLHRLIVRLAGAEAGASGHFDLAGMGDFKLKVKAEDLSRLSRAKLPGVPDLAGAFFIDATAARSPEHLRVDADIHGSDLRVMSAARVRRLSAHVHAVDLTGEARLDARGLLASGLAFDSLALRARGGKDSAELHVDGYGPYGNTFLLDVHGVPRQFNQRPIALDATLSRLVLAAHGQTWRTPHPAFFHVGDDVTVKGFALSSAGQDLRVDGSYGMTSKKVSATVNLHALDVKKVLQLAAISGAANAPTTSLDLRARASGTVAHPIAEVELSGRSETVAKIGLDAMTYQLRARYADVRATGELAVKSLVPKGPALNVCFDAPAGGKERGPLGGELSLDGLLIEKFQRFLPPSLAALKGQVALHARAGGTLHEPRLEAVLDVPNWEVDDLKKNHSKLTVNYDDTGFSARLTTQIAAAHGPDLASADVSVTVPIDLALDTKLPKLDRLELDTQMKAHADFKLDVARLRKVSGAAAARLPLNTGQFDVTMDFSGTANEPRLSAKVNGKDLSTDAIDQAEVGLGLDYQRGKARLDLNTRLRGQTLLLAHGETTVDPRKLLAGAPLKDTPIFLDAFVPAYELARSTQFAGLVVANVAARGTIGKPEVGLQFRIDGLRAQRLDIGDMRVTGRGTFDGQKFGARFDLREEKGGVLHLDAAAPLRADLPLRADISSNGFLVDYRSNAGLGGLRLLHGLLNADVNISGTRQSPRVAGYVRIKEGAFALAVDPSTYEDVQLDVSVKNGALTLKNLSAKSGDGWAKASGSAQLEGLAPVRADLLAEINHFPSMAGDTGFYVDARVKAHAQTSGDTLTGEVTVLNGMVRLPKLKGQRQLQPLKPMTDVVFTDTRAAQARRAQEAQAQATQSSSSFPSHIVITASIPGQVYVRSTEVNTGLHGMVQADLDGPDVRLTGSAETLSGWLELMGRRYEIDHAKVAFGGEPVPNPELDVRVTRQISDAQIIIEVHGNAAKPELVLSSEPPLYSQSQIIGIIIGGDPNAEPQSSQNLQQKAVGAVSGLILGQIKDQFASKLPIDVLKIDLGNQGYGFESTRLEVGKYLTDDLYLSYLHQFGNLSGLRKINANQASLEYHFLRAYSFQTLFGDAGVGSLDFYWTHRF